MNSSVHLMYCSFRDNLLSQCFNFLHSELKLEIYTAAQCTPETMYPGVH